MHQHFDAAENEAHSELLENPKQEWALRQVFFVMLAKGDLEACLVAAQKALEINPYWEPATFFLEKHLRS